VAIETYAEDDWPKRIIKIQGCSNVSMHFEFRDAYCNVTNSGNRFVLDFSDVTYLGSAAPGMILLLREHAQESAFS
jgi:anti-anti-sigma regulatory factor